MSLLNSLKIEEKITKNNPHTSTFVFHHLPSDMGITIGNYLRRILLSHISGLAPIAVKITDKNGPTKSKFSTLEGVKEATAYLILNLRKVIVEEKKPHEGIFSLKIKVENKGENEKIITADDFTKSKEVEVKNPEIYLATLASGKSLEIELYFRRGWGYHEAEEQKKEYFVGEEDVIVLDSDYSPIKGGQVNFQVKKVVVNLIKEEEELEFTINTDRTISPKNALLEALEISRNSFGTVINLINGEKK